MEKNHVAVIKVTLSTGKVVFLREPKIADTETAVTITGKGNTDNEALLSLKTQAELIKLILVKVDDKELTLAEKESLDSLFTIIEFNQLKKVSAKLMGAEEGNEPTIEFTSL